jgi:hypothetical protein
VYIYIDCHIGLETSPYNGPLPSSSPHNGPLPSDALNSDDIEYPWLDDTSQEFHCDNGLETSSLVPSVQEKPSIPLVPSILLVPLVPGEPLVPCKLLHKYFHFLCSLLMLYWTSLCVLRRTSRQE